MDLLISEWSVRFLIATFCLMLGYWLGHICPWERVRGTHKYYPNVVKGVKNLRTTRKPKFGTIVFMLFALLAIFSVWSRTESLNAQEDAVKEQAACNFEYRRVLNERSDLANRRTNNVDNVIVGTLDLMLAQPSPDGRGLFINLLNSYKVERDDINKKLAENPYPDPRCLVETPFAGDLEEYQEPR